MSFKYLFLFYIYFSIPIYCLRPSRIISNRYGDEIDNSRNYENDENLDEQMEPQEVDYEQTNEQDFVKRDLTQRYGDDEEPNADKYEVNEKSNKNTEKREVADMTDDEIAMALSRLSPNELLVLDNLVNAENFNEDSNADIEEQELLRKARSNKKQKKIHKDEDDEDDEDVDDEKDDDGTVSKLFDNKQCYDNNCDGECNVKKLRVRGKRNATANEAATEPPPPAPNNTAPASFNESPSIIHSKKSKRHILPNFKKRNIDANVEKKIHSKINYLGEKTKRELSPEYRRHIKKCKKSPQRNSRIAAAWYVRRKRENNQISADNPKSPEHIKLLEESFPIPAASKSFQDEQPLVRVKRDD